MVYVTAGDKGEAERIGGEIVKLRLAACVNVLDGMGSIYWWKGKVEREEEAVLILKTRQDLVEEVIAKAREMHSYENPCIIAYPAISGCRD